MTDIPVGSEAYRLRFIEYEFMMMLLHERLIGVNAVAIHRAREKLSDWNRDELETRRSSSGSAYLPASSHAALHL